jgi:hypothetical protein
VRPTASRSVPNPCVSGPRCSAKVRPSNRHLTLAALLPLRTGGRRLASLRFTGDSLAVRAGHVPSCGWRPIPDIRFISGSPNHCSPRDASDRPRHPMPFVTCHCDLVLAEVAGLSPIQPTELTG